MYVINNPSYPISRSKSKLLGVFMGEILYVSKEIVSYPLTQFLGVQCGKSYISKRDSTISSYTVAIEYNKRLVKQIFIRCYWDGVRGNV